MRMQIHFGRLIWIVVVAAGFGASGSWARAANYTWDPSGDPSDIQGGDGTWNLSNWATAGHSNNVAWASGAHAVFAPWAGSNSVTVDGTLSVSGIEFYADTNVFEINSGTLHLDDSNVTVAAGKVA